MTVPYWYEYMYGTVDLYSYQYGTGRVRVEYGTGTGSGTVRYRYRTSTCTVWCRDKFVERGVIYADIFPGYVTRKKFNNTDNYSNMINRLYIQLRIFFIF